MNIEHSARLQASDKLEEIDLIDYANVLRLSYRAKDNRHELLNWKNIFDKIIIDLKSNGIKVMYQYSDQINERDLLHSRLDLLPESGLIVRDHCIYELRASGLVRMSRCRGYFYRYALEKIDKDLLRAIVLLLSLINFKFVNATNTEYVTALWHGSRQLIVYDNPRYSRYKVHQCRLSHVLTQLQLLVEMPQYKYSKRHLSNTVIDNLLRTAPEENAKLIKQLKSILPWTTSSTPSYPYVSIGDLI